MSKETQKARIVSRLDYMISVINDLESLTTGVGPLQWENARGVLRDIKDMVEEEYGE